MTPRSQLKLHRIQLLSRYLRVLCASLLAIVAALFLFCAAAALAGGDISLAVDDLRIPLAGYPLPTRLFLLGLVALVLGILGKALFHLYRLFGHYAAGRILTAQAARQIRHIGWTALLWFVLNILVAVALARLVNGTQPVPVPLRFDALLLALILIAISWFIEAAAELQEENQLTI